MTNDQNQDDKDDLQEKIEAATKEAEAVEETAQKGSSKGDQIEELTAALARAMADLQNFKRRGEEEKASFVKFANAEALKALIPIIDNLDRSTNHLPEELKDNEWSKGIVQIHSDLLKTMDKLGVKKMEVIGEKLDPNKHEALMSGPGEKDIIIEEFEPGYIYHEATLKPAKVKVGDGSQN